MKRVFLLMTTILLMAAASGCMQTPQEEAPPEQEPEQSQPLHLTSLSIELQRDGQNAQQLLKTRAYNYRGRNTILRNIKIVQEEKDEQ